MCHVCARAAASTASWPDVQHVCRARGTECWPAQQLNKDRGESLPGRPIQRNPGAARSLCGEVLEQDAHGLRKKWREELGCRMVIWWHVLAHADGPSK
jgi:hypothetical protein